MSGIGTGVSARSFVLTFQAWVIQEVTLVCIRGMQYDLSVSTFSPDGRVFQTDYAQKAVDNSG